MDLKIQNHNFKLKLVHVWIDDEFDGMMVSHHDFGKSYTLKFQQNQFHMIPTIHLILKLKSIPLNKTKTVISILRKHQENTLSNPQFYVPRITFVSHK